MSKPNVGSSTLDSRKSWGGSKVGENLQTLTPFIDKVVG